MRARVYTTKAEAESEIATENVRKGYPRTERGVRVGAGIFADSITTASASDVVRVASGFAVPVEPDAKDAIAVERLDPDAEPAPAPLRVR